MRTVNWFPKMESARHSSQVPFTSLPDGHVTLTTLDISNYRKAKITVYGQPLHFLKKYLSYITTYVLSILSSRSHVTQANLHISIYTILGTNIHFHYTSWTGLHQALLRWHMIYNHCNIVKEMCCTRSALIWKTNFCFYLFMRSCKNVSQLKFTLSDNLYDFYDFAHA